MEKFYWEPDRTDRMGIVSGIFAVDGIGPAEIETLINTFPTQSVDFFGALRSRLYDEQVLQFIQSVGLDQVSARVVNSTEPPPEFRKPDFSLSHLIEVGHQLVQEQKRVQELNLSEEYNKFLYNRRLGDTADAAIPSSISQSPPTSFYRSYESVLTEPGNGQVKPTSYQGQSSSTRISPEMATTINQVLNQGDRLGIEYANERRFRINSWHCFATVQGNGSDAMDTLEACLNEHPNDYVRLVSIRSKDRRRVAETIIQRSSSQLHREPSA
jgi:ribulose bisphosphate carboxylase small subunit